MQLQFDVEQDHDGGMVERRFCVGDVPGILWTPDNAATSQPLPLVLLGHPGRMTQMRPRLLARARSAAEHGFASAAIELPWTGDRPGSREMDQARADLRGALEAGQQPSSEVIDRLILPLVDKSAPEWQATIDAVQQLDEIGDAVGLSGGVISIAVRLAATDTRIRAASLFAGSLVPAQILHEARSVTIPLQVLLQWDDEGNDRQMALDLFDAFSSAEKSLIANMGGHTGIPAHAGQAATQFLHRHLRRAKPPATQHTTPQKRSTL